MLRLKPNDRDFFHMKSIDAAHNRMFSFSHLIAGFQRNQISVPPRRFSIFPSISPPIHMQVIFPDGLSRTVSHLLLIADSFHLAQHVA
jgi:hypothetical protein